MVSTSELPSLMRLQNGQTVQNPQDWARRRIELSQAALALVYGPLPPVPAATRAVLLHEALQPATQVLDQRVAVDHYAGAYLFE